MRNCLRREPARRITGLALNADVATVIFHHAIDQAETQARALTFLFGCKKGFEDPGLNGFRDAGAAIGNFNLNMVAVSVESSADMQTAIALHGLCGI